MRIRHNGTEYNDPIVNDAQKCFVCRQEDFGGYSGYLIRSAPNAALRFVMVSGSGYYVYEVAGTMITEYQRFTSWELAFQRAGISLQWIRLNGSQLGRFEPVEFVPMPETFWPGEAGSSTAFFYSEAFSLAVFRVSLAGLSDTTNRTRSEMGDPITREEAVARLNEDAPFQGNIPNPSFRTRFGATLVQLIDLRSALRFGTVRAQFNIAMPRDLDVEGEKEWLKANAPRTPIDPRAAVATPPVRAAIPAPPRPTFDISVDYTETERFTQRGTNDRSGRSTYTVTSERIAELMEEHDNDVEEVVSALTQEAEQYVDENPPDTEVVDTDLGDQTGFETESSNSSANLRMNALRDFIAQHELEYHEE